MEYRIYYAEVGTEHPSNTAWLEKDGRWCAEALDVDDVRIASTNAHSAFEALQKILKMTDNHGRE